MTIELCKSREEAYDMMMNKCLITRLFLRKGCDINEFNIHISFFRRRQRQNLNGWFQLERPLWLNKSQYFKLWLSFLRDQTISDDYAYFPNMTFTNLQATIAVLHNSTLQTYLDPTQVTETVFMLCALGADVSATGTYPSIYNIQPLHLIALIPYSPDMAFYIKTLFKILLDFGADPCARDKQGRTILHIALDNGWDVQWREALKDCNQLQVFMEQFEAVSLGREEGPLHITTRTGVDTTDLSKPSAQGLSRRIASRGDRLDD